MCLLAIKIRVFRGLEQGKCVQINPRSLEAPPECLSGCESE